MRRVVCFPVSLLLILPLWGCVSAAEKNAGGTPDIEFDDLDRSASVFGPDQSFVGSPFEDVGRSGLFPTRAANTSEIAVLANGDDSFSVRMQALRQADPSVRIQALMFNGDESGIHIAGILKQKKEAGLDVRIIVDAFSNPALQAQWLYFDLKQNGIEVEGYEAMALQWINEVPVPYLTPHFDPERPDKRFHDKMWIIDGDTDHAVAVTGGLNIGNEYFRIDPGDPDHYWRDQDVIVRGAVIEDMVAVFDRNFDYLVGIKESRGIFNTNLYWDNTRAVMDATGKLPISYDTDPVLVATVEAMARKKLDPDFRPARSRFFQNRPRFDETYIEQVYLRLILAAREEILIANAYFVPTRPFRQALKDAVARCVSVTIISNSPETNDLPEISMVGRGYYKELLQYNEQPVVAACANDDAGIRIWEWVGQRVGSERRTEHTMHSKYAVFDRSTSLVGSYNLDPRSQNLNSETALVFASEPLSRQLVRLFEENDLAFSRQVSPRQAAEFENPDDVVYRFRKSIGQFFESQL